MNVDSLMSVEAGGAVIWSGSKTPHLGEAIEAILGRATFVDLTFPRCAFLLSGVGETRFALMASPDARSRDFVTSFRQLGGHQPIGLLSHAPESGDLAALRQLLPVGRVPVYVADCLDTARMLAALKDDEPVNILVPMALDAASEALPTPLGIPDFTLFSFFEEGVTSRLWLLYASRSPAAHGQSPANIQARQSAPEVQKIMRLERGKHIISARQLIHDGGYRAEGDESYSWLWTGPDPCFRTVIPRRTCNFPKRIEVTIVRTEHPQNLDNIRVQLDGRNAPFHFERWSDISGKVVIDLPDCADYTILGLIIPMLDTDKNSGRAIGLCLDKLILMPD